MSTAAFDNFQLLKTFGGCEVSRRQNFTGVDVAIVQSDKWCEKCASVKPSLKGRDFYLCLTCFSRNDGKHPAESCLAVRYQQALNKDKLRKEANKKRVFPRLPHTTRRRKTTVSMRSMNLQRFKKS